MAAYETGNLDELASKQWPHWIPIRHRLGIETFGVNAYRRDAGEGLVPEHDESDSGAPELYYVASGSAVFTIEGEDVDAPAGTCVWVSDPGARRSAEARADGTVVLAIGAAAPGEPYTPAGWDSRYLADES